MDKKGKESPKQRILIVEDNATNIKLFRDVLVNAGLHVNAIEDGLIAVDEAIAFKPDLILLDVQLKKISGLDIVKQLKANKDLAHIPVVAVTAFAMSDDREKILEAGFDHYIAKPISIAIFLQEVFAMLEPKAA